VRWRWLRTLVALGWALIGSTRLSAQWPNGPIVQHTPHNLTRPAASTAPDMLGRIRNYGEICVYCHTPHGGPDWLGAPRTPLWNRDRPNSSYRMPEFSTQRMLQDPAPSDRSRVCLSCHDGSLGLDLVTNRPNTYTGPTPANHAIEECEGCHSGGNPAGGIDWEGVWFRPDLRKQHPFSVIYDPSRRPGEFQSAIGGTVGGLPLFDGKVECATCHQPHSEQFRYFLRRSNVGGTLCLVCHTSPPSEPVHQR
jgi:predicted CXXCH cytochrome family protein